MFIGKDKTISCFTQHVPILIFASVIVQIYATEKKINEIVHLEGIISFYERINSFLAFFYIFTSLATNHHYFWNLFVTSPLYVLTVGYISIQKEQLVLNLISENVERSNNTDFVIGTAIATSALIVFISYQNQLEICKMIIDKHLETK